MSLNKVMLIGRLTRDPEMRYTPSGQPLTSFGIATNRYGSGTDGERREFTDFHNVVVWNIGKRALAEIVAQYCKKGSLVYVEGRLQTRSWEGQDGQKRQRTEVVCTEIQFLDTRSSSGAQAGAGQQGVDDAPPMPDYGDSGAAPSGVRDVDPDDIPF